jgi:hypothetical protein
MLVKFSESKSLQRDTNMISAEAMGEDNSKLTMMDRLTEVFLTQLLRYALQARAVESGMRSDLAHRQRCSPGAQVVPYTADSITITLSVCSRATR